MCGHLPIKHKEGQVPAVTGAAWEERMLYGLTCSPAPLQAGDRWACFYHSLMSVDFADGSRAQMDFCTMMPLASASALAHHSVHVRVHLSVGLWDTLCPQTCCARRVDACARITCA